jgi:hypothetical protein
MEEIKKESVYLEDGRKADKITQEKVGVAAGEVQVVTEVYAEPKIEKKLTSRVIEHRKPVVHKREIELVDENGDVVEKKVESIEPEVTMQLREHIKTENQVGALSVNDDCNCYVTPEEMQKTFTEGFMKVAEIISNRQPTYMPEVDSPKVSAMQAMIGDKMAEEEKPDTLKKILWGTAAALSATFVYLAFLM